MKGMVVRTGHDRRSFATSLAVSALVHAAVLGAAVVVAPQARPRLLLETAAPEAVGEPELVTLVWPLESHRSEPRSSATVEEVAAATERDLDDDVGDVAVGDLTDATVSGAPADTDAPLSADAPAAQGLGTLALDAPLAERTPSAARGALVAEQPIAVPEVHRTVLQGEAEAGGSAREEEEDEEDEQGGGVGSILDGLGGFLDGIKVSVGGSGGGGEGGGGMGGRGKGGCVPGIGGIIGGRGRPGTVAIPQGPGIRTGIGGRTRFPFAGGGDPIVGPARKSAC
jgi:hypothetical protein